MSTKGKPLAIAGVILQFGTLLGIAGTVIGMVRAFPLLGQHTEEAQQAVAEYIALALYTTAGGMVLSAAGTILLLIALFRVKYRAPWFRVALWIFSILWLFSIPIGTILGIVVIVYLVKHKAEFIKPRVVEGAPL